MAANSDLTKHTHDVCRALVCTYLPGEADLFDPIWSAVLRILRTERIEDLQVAPAWNTSEVSGAILAAMGDTSQQVFDALYVIAAVVGAVVTLLQEGRSTILETVHIHTALQEQAERLRVPSRVSRILEAFATPLLAEQLAAADWHGRKGRPESHAAGALWVEWCEPARGEAELPPAESRVMSRIDAGPAHIKLLVSQGLPSGTRCSNLPCGSCP